MASRASIPTLDGGGSCHVWCRCGLRLLVRQPVGIEVALVLSTRHRRPFLRTLLELHIEAIQSVLKRLAVCDNPWVVWRLYIGPPRIVRSVGGSVAAGVFVEDDLGSVLVLLGLAPAVLLISICKRINERKCVK